jgi:hypothetical protein
MTNEVGTNNARSRRPHRRAARRFPILKNQWVKPTLPSYFFKSLPWVVEQNACRLLKFQMLEPMPGAHVVSCGSHDSPESRLSLTDFRGRKQEPFDRLSFAP